jgi:predicted ribosomally synthesized peptide with SipW-like signal peptide
MKNRKLIAISAAAALLAGGVAIGGTYALFTADASNDVEISAGNVAVSTKVVLTAATSGEENASVMTAGNTTAATFQNGGKVELDAATGTVNVTNMTPMDSFTIKVTPKNKSNVNIKYRLLVSVNGALADGLKVTVDGTTKKWGEGILTDWLPLAANTDFAATDVKEIKVEMPRETGNDYELKKGSISVSYSAIQGNANTGYKLDAGAKTLEIYDESGMVYMDEHSADLLDYTITIDKNMDMGFMNWNPFGYGDEIHGSSSKNFVGTFNGNGNYINNLKVFKDAVTNDTTTSVYNYGFFASLGEGANVKDVTFNNALVLDEYKAYSTDSTYRKGNMAGIIAGKAVGAATLSNVRAWNSAVVGYAKVGSLIGYTTGGTQTVTDSWAYNNQITACCEAGGVYGAVTRKAGAETISISGGFIYGNTWTKADSNPYNYTSFTSEQGNFTADDTATGTATVKTVTGTYWLDGFYYYGAYADKYVSMGGDYAAPLTNNTSYFFAYSERLVG